MSTSTEITRLTTARNTIRAKLKTLGLATDVDKLDTLAGAISGITNNGAVQATVREGESYTIPAGYHNGAGTVAGIAGGGNYDRQEKSHITPTKQSVTVTPDNGYYALSSVQIDPIPDAYQDVTSVTATAADVLATKVFVESDGSVTTGTMPNNGAISRTLDGTTTSTTIDAGYHNGSGTVSIVTEQKTGANAITPTTSTQTITPATGKVLTAVEVKPIPAAYQDVSTVTATAADIRTGKVAIAADGSTIDGELTDRGTVAATIDGLTTTSYTIAAGIHSGSGTVSLTNDIETALAAI